MGIMDRSFSVNMRPGTLTLLDVSLANPCDNLRFDEELLAAGNGVLRLWETAQECVVIGQSGRPERDVKLDACRADGIPVLRRCSGGGAVVLGPGCLNYSLVLPIAWNPRWQNVRYSFQWTMHRMRHALSIRELRHEGDSDLALHGCKVSGNAQRRTDSAILHHGTLLYSFEASRAERLLAFPHRQPGYRAGRSHRDFLGNLPLTAGEIRQRLASAWCEESWHQEIAASPKRPEHFPCPLHC
jgi:lipoate-protein ligase A